MENKQYDLFLTRLNNPEYDAGAMQIAGITSDNTSLRDASDYKNRKDVQSNPMFHTPSGNFDESKFNKFYNESKQIYNYLANSDRDTLLLEQIKYDKSNIYAPVDKKKLEPTFKVIKIDNPFRQKSSMSVLGKMDERTKSISELAQQEKFLTNPIEVQNGAAPIWEEAPEDGNFFKKMLDTRTKVLAVYEEDVFDEEGNKIHEKGHFKLNDNGVPYYEALEGRSVYGRQVLNKMDILTKEDSKLNKYDVFDSDDIKKSFGGSLLKNTLLVGSLFIPYVGKGLALASILNASVGLFGTLGKMFSGSDNNTSALFSEMEGWAKQTSKSTVSEYAQGNAWCWENFFNLIGSVTNQLVEQRFIFNYAPMIKYGKYGATEKGQKEFVEKEIKRLTQSNIDETGLKLLALQNSNAIKANAALAEYMQNYNQTGKILGQLYMTLITTLDTYGEAKSNNATDWEATALTIGYAAAEYALLNTEIGQWIMPELKQNKLKNKAIAEAIASDTNKNLFDKYKNIDSKANTLKWFNKGKEVAKKVYNNLGTGGKTISATIAAASAEAVEEVSEELLSDLSKSCFNLVNILQGDKVRMDVFQDVPTRYAMSLFGGFVGGGIANLKNNYILTRDLNSLTGSSAMQELIYMIRNGGTEDFLNDLNNVTLGSKNLSASERDANGYWKQGTEEDNQDKALKSLIKNQLRDMQLILNAEGLNISDDTFLDIQTRNDLQLRTLQASTISTKYLQDFNNISAEIVALTEKIQSLNNSISDEEKRKNESIVTSTDQEISRLNDKLNKLRVRKEDLLAGNLSGEFMEQALYELNTFISSRFIAPTFELFAYQQTGKYVSALSENEYNEIKKRYDTWTSTNKKDDIETGSKIFRTFLETVSNSIYAQAEKYNLSTKEVIKGNSVNIDSILGVQTGRINLEQVNTETSDITNELQNALSSYLAENNNLLIHLIGVYNGYGKDNLKDLLEKEQQATTEEEKDTYGRRIYNFLQENYLSKNMEEAERKSRAKRLVPLIEGFLENNDYVNPEIKINLLKIINNILVGADSESITNPNIIKLIKLKKALAKKSSTPIIENLIDFTKKIVNNEEIDSITETLKSIDNILTSNIKDFSNVNIENHLENIDKILKIIDLYDVAIDALRVDNFGINNLWGYAKTLNELNPDKPQLALIDGDFANVIEQDLLLIRNKLKFVKDVHTLNRGRKLNTQNRVDLRFKYITYDKLQQFLKYLPGGWVDNDKLREVVNKAENLKKYSESNDLGVNNDIQLELEKEFVEIQDAIYDYFQTNSMKDFTELLNNKSLNLFDKANELITEKTKELDSNSFVWWLASRASIKASSFCKEYGEIIKTVGGFNENGELIKDDKIDKRVAPLSSQAIPIYLAYARIANGRFFDKFREAYRKNIKEQWKDKSLDDRVETLLNLETDRKSKQDKHNDAVAGSSDELAQYVFDFIDTPIYRNIVLVEGIAGSGKSTAVGRFIKEMLQKFHPEILNNAVIVHASEEGVKSLAKSMNINSDKTTLYNNKQQFLPTIINNYVEKTKNEKGVYTFTSDDVYLNSENEHSYKYSLNDSSKVPSIIFLDEITLFSAQELQAVDAYARKHGIIVIGFGDYDQQCASGRYDVTYNSKKYEKTVSTNRLNFIRSPKLGVSMRSANTQVTVNEHAIQAFINNDTLNNLELHYYQNNEGIYGDKIYYDRDSEGTFNETNKKSILADIDLMIATSEKKDGKLVHKIGYIYNDKNSWLYKELQDSKYKESVELKFSSDIQGLEGDYFIVDLNQKLLEDSSSAGDANTTLLRIINTCATRKKKGNLFIAKDTDLERFLNLSNVTLTNIKDKDTVLEKLEDNEIITFAQKRLNIYNKIIPEDTENVEFLPEIKEELSQEAMPEDKGFKKETSKDFVLIGQETIKINSTITVDGKEYTVITITEDNKIIVSVDNSQKVFTLEQFKDLYNRASTKGDNSKGPILLGGGGLVKEKEIKREVDESSKTKEPIVTDNSYLPVLIYTFNTFEFGIPVKKENDIYIIDKDKYNEEDYTYRQDSLLGLAKCTSEGKITDNNINDLISILGLLRSTIYTSTDKSSLIKNIERILKQKKLIKEDVSLYCTFGFKSMSTTIKDYDKDIFNKYKLNENEKTHYTNGNDTNSANISSKKLILLIGDVSKGDFLEIPLFTLSNPYTLLNRNISDENSKYKTLFNACLDIWNNENVELDFPKKVQNLIDFLNKNGNNYDDKAVKSLKNYLKVFLYSDNDVTYIKDNEWVPNKNLQNLGVQYATTSENGIVKGQSQLKEGYTTTDEWYDLNDYDLPPGMTKTNTPYILRAPLDNSDIIVGHPFILVSYDSSLNTDEKLIEVYKNQLSNDSEPKRVRFIYVVPPKASFEEYIEYLNKRFNEQEKDDNVIGDGLTSYHIFKQLIGSKSEDFKQILNVRKQHQISGKHNTENRTNAFDFIEGIISFLEKSVDNVLKEAKNSDSNLSRERCIFNKLTLTVNEIIEEMKNSGEYESLFENLYKINEEVKNITLSTLFNNWLKDVCTNYENEVFTLDTNNINIIQNILGEDFGIFYASISNISKDERTLYDILKINNNLSYKVHAKIDSPVFMGNLDFLFEEIVKKLDSRQDGKLSTNGNYLHGNSNLNNLSQNPNSSNPNSMEETIKNGFLNSIRESGGNSSSKEEEEILNNLIKEIKQENSTLNIDEQYEIFSDNLVQKINESNYLPILIIGNKVLRNNKFKTSCIIEEYIKEGETDVITGARVKINDISYKVLFTNEDTASLDIINNNTLNQTSNISTSEKSIEDKENLGAIIKEVNRKSLDEIPQEKEGDNIKLTLPDLSERQISEKDLEDLKKLDSYIEDITGIDTANDEKAVDKVFEYVKANDKEAIFKDYKSINNNNINSDTKKCVSDIVINSISQLKFI